MCVIKYLLLCVQLSDNLLVHVVHNAMHMRHVLHGKWFKRRWLVVLYDKQRNMNKNKSHLFVFVVYVYVVVSCRCCCHVAVVA